GAGKRPGGAAADPLLLKAGRIIIATGASPREVPGLPVDGRRIWNYRHALVPEAIPASLLVVGAGAIGMEFASFYAALGSQVTVVACAGTGLAAGRREDAVRVTFGPQAARLDAGFDRVLVCAGVAGNIASLGLETTRVRTTPAGCIVVDRQGATAEPGIHAIG